MTWRIDMVCLEIYNPLKYNKKYTEKENFIENDETIFHRIF
jgi:hypothetical protein